jgi:hypothetical protein
VHNLASGVEPVKLHTAPYLLNCEMIERRGTQSRDAKR